MRVIRLHAYAQLIKVKTLTAAACLLCGSQAPAMRACQQYHVVEVL
jgi:hypothetical protein